MVAWRGTSSPRIRKRRAATSAWPICRTARRGTGGPRSSSTWRWRCGATPRPAAASITAANSSPSPARCRRARPAGHPLLVQAGGSPQGRELAGRVADAVFSAELDLDAAIEHYRYVKDAAVAHGRGRDAVRILPGLITTIGSSRAEAQRRYEEQNALLPAGHDVERLSQTLGADLSGLPLDEPIPARLLGSVPDPSKFVGSLGFRESVVRLVVSGGLTLRQTLRAFSGSGHRVIVGSPVDVADTIEQWFGAGAADGFNLMPDVFPDGLEVFVDEVVPILRSRGLFRASYAEATLRERLTGDRHVVAA
ncbi:luciferase-like monooxygenase family protein [Mycobacterium sp. MAC_080597_8934]|nr:luciferase-like monooxygenase family protein [Mycobacterium sp. MAC_080597_8934]